MLERRWLLSAAFNEPPITTEQVDTPAALLAHAAVRTEDQKLTASGGGFGGFIAIDGGITIVGAPYVSEVADRAGAAHIFRLDGGQWILRQTVTASSPSWRLCRGCPGT